MYFGGRQGSFGHEVSLAPTKVLIFSNWGREEGKCLGDEENCGVSLNVKTVVHTEINTYQTSLTSVKEKYFIIRSFYMTM